MGLWWWTGDRWTVLSLVAMMGFGALLMLAASPAATERIGLQSFQLARRQITLLPFAAALLIPISLATPRWVRRLACLALLAYPVLRLLQLMTRSQPPGPPP